VVLKENLRREPLIEDVKSTLRAWRLGGSTSALVRYHNSCYGCYVKSIAMEFSPTIRLEKVPQFACASTAALRSIGIVP
jgi:hypothetical protein